QGRAAPGLEHHIEIRGLGVLNVADLFGELATLNETRLSLAIEVVEEIAGGPVERLGIDDRTPSILGVDGPYLQIQPRPGRDVATLIEVAARNGLLKRRGIHAAQRFVAGLERNLRRVGGRARR